MLSDEEKKAIEELRKLPITLLNCHLGGSAAINTVLNLIEKQSKEIEELKKPKYIINFETNEITTLTNEFISKDKIKAKIEEIKNDCKKCRFTGFCKDLLKNNQCSQGEAIKVLQSLLEEE